jgi:hypothetical protein
VHGEKQEDANEDEEQKDYYMKNEKKEIKGRKKYMGSFIIYCCVVT